MSGSLDVTGSFIVPFGTSSVTASYEKGRMMIEKDSGRLFVWTGSWSTIGGQDNPSSAPTSVFNDAVGNLTASISSGTNLVTMSLSEADNITSTPYSASISGSSFEIVFSNADSSSGFIRNTTTLSEGTYYYNVTIFDSGSINSQSYNNQTVAVAAPPSYGIEYLVVAGGASGGSNGGGGGAGGLLSGSISISAGVSLAATVGGGGAAQTTYQNQGNDGSDSSLIGTGVSYTSNGGGGGASNNSYDGRDGGSGGGGGTQYNAAGTGGSGTVGQGNDGGDIGSTGHPYVGAGGGGAGQAGEDGAHDSPGNGGDGKQSGITGTLTYYAGGGGGTAGTGVGYTGDGGDGGQGGGGDSLAYNDDGLPGTANTGGGGGASGDGRDSGAGGSGIVILRMLSSNYSGTTTGSPTVSTDGSYKVVKFTSSGTYTT